MKMRGFELLCIGPLLWVTLVTAVQELDLPRQWQDMQLNCSTGSVKIESMTVPEATSVFDQLGYDRRTRGQWLYDIGEWLLLNPGHASRARAFVEASAKIGNPHAQFIVGALATVASSTTSSSSDTALHYHFASQGGSMAAHMAMGYRHRHGYGSPRSCETSLRYYKIVADEVMREKHALPNPAVPIQVFSVPPPTRFTDDQTNQPRLDKEDFQRAEYLRQKASYVGSSSSRKLLVRAASLVLFSDLYQHNVEASTSFAAQENAKSLLERAANLGSNSALAMLGHVYAYGLAGVSADAYEALQYYQDALNSTSASKDESDGRGEAATGIGLLYFHGHGGVPIDYERAMSYFKIASHYGHAEGVYYAAVIMMHANPKKSLEYLEAAASVGHVGAIFRLARLKEKHRFRGDEMLTCEAVVDLYKQVAEHNKFGRRFLSKAADAFVRGSTDQALQLYLIASQMGYEVAQHNAAWLTKRFVLSSLRDAAPSAQYRDLAEKAAAQGSADGAVRLGDLEYVNENYRLAMRQYLKAIEVNPRHARALYSAGYMCEHGLGTITRGPNLDRAHWYYDQASNSEKNKVMAVILKLLRLKINAQQLIAEIHRKVWRTSNQLTSQVAGSGSANSKPVSLDNIKFRSALVFDGATSTVVVDDMWLTNPMNGFTMAIWMRLEDAPTDSTPMVLVEWEDLRVELVPHISASAWSLRLVSDRDGQLSMLTLTKCMIRPTHWHEITLVFDIKRNKVSVFIGDELVDYGNFLFGAPSVLRLLHIGKRPTEDSNSRPFRGQVIRFRLWDQSPVQASDEHSSLGSPHRSLQLDLAGNIFPTEGKSFTDAETATVLDSSAVKRPVKATDIGIQMILL